MIDTTIDAPDALVGDGVCAVVGSKVCSLRAAIEETNAHPGVDEIQLPTSIDGNSSYAIDLSIRLVNSIVGSSGSANSNDCDAPPDAVVSMGGNVFRLAPTCVVAMRPTDRIVTDLGLVQARAASPVALPGLANIGMAPLPNSPAIDAAESAACPAVDQFGHSRPAPTLDGASHRCDSGAIEWPADRVFDDGYE